MKIAALIVGIIVVIVLGIVIRGGRSCRNCFVQLVGTRR
jgi:hypothetical protein